MELKDSPEEAVELSLIDSPSAALVTDGRVPSPPPPDGDGWTDVVAKKAKAERKKQKKARLAAKTAEKKAPKNRKVVSSSTDEDDVGDAFNTKRKEKRDVVKPGSMTIVFEPKKKAPLTSNPVAGSSPDAGPPATHAVNATPNAMDDAAMLGLISEAEITRQAIAEAEVTSKTLFVSDGDGSVNAASGKGFLEEREMATSYLESGKNDRLEKKDGVPLSSEDSPAAKGVVPQNLNHGPADKDGTPLTTRDTSNKGGTPLTSGEVPVVKDMGPLISPAVNHCQNSSLNAQNDLDCGPTTSARKRVERPVEEEIAGLMYDNEDDVAGGSPSKRHVKGTTLQS